MSQPRPNYLPPTGLYALNLSCTLLDRAFDCFGVYLVGSAIERRDYRDVDVRLIMNDAAYDKLFSGNPGERETGGAYDPLWSLLCLSISTWLTQQTGLPIDFQIQRQTQANATHHGRRQALGVFLDYPGERPSGLRDGKDGAA